MHSYEEMWKSLKSEAQDRVEKYALIDRKSHQWFRNLIFRMEEIEDSFEEYENFIKTLREDNDAFYNLLRK